MYTKWMVSVALILCCTGCATGIRVVHLGSSDLPPPGVPWNLAMTQFNVAITRHVTGCVGELKGTVEVTITPTKVLDDEQRYALYADGWWATSDITSNLAADGTSTN